MKSQRRVHILNGDSLKEQFPESLDAEIIVARECLVEGDISGSNLNEFFRNRAAFLIGNGEPDWEEYFNKSASEFQRIMELKADAEVNLWFEDDLFCQVNFWFTIHLIVKYTKVKTVYLVRPELENRYGFSGHDKDDLERLFVNRMKLTGLDRLAKLWEHYQSSDITSLQLVAKDIETHYPFISEAVQAHVERLPSGSDPGRVIRSLKEIMKELNTEEFGPVFQEFCAREAIYGFGDSHVKRLLSEIKEEN
jgi:hypothetical protein